MFISEQKLNKYGLVVFLFNRRYYKCRESVMRETGFLDGLLTTEEMNHENIKDKDSKIAVLQKVIDAVSTLTGIKLTVRPSKIVAGHEPDKTNELLQAIAAAIDQKISSKEYVAQLNGKSSRKAADKKEERKKKSSVPASSPKVKSEAQEKKPRDASQDKKRTRDHSTGKREKESSSDTRKKETRGKNLESSAKDKMETISSKKVKETNSEKKLKEKSQFSTEITNKKHEETLPKPIDFQKKVEETPTEDVISLQGKAEQIDEENIIQEGDSSKVQEIDANKVSSNIADSFQVLGENIISQENFGEEQPLSTFKKSSIQDESQVKKAPKEMNEPKNIDLAENQPTLLESKPNDSDETDNKSSIQPLAAANHPYSNNQVFPARPRSARPASARPPSARPAAPRIRERNEQMLAEQIRSAVAKVNIITESDTSKENDDSENFVIEEQSTPIIEEAPSPVPSTSAPTLDEAAHGQLVSQILETQKKLETDSQHSSVTQTRKIDIEWEPGQRRDRDATVREVERIQQAIQTLTRAANPLGKLMDFLQEDVDTMQRELTMWSSRAKQYNLELLEEQRRTEELVEPLKLQLNQLQSEIQKQKIEISRQKAKILQNDSQIQKFVTGYGLPQYSPVI